MFIQKFIHTHIEKGGNSIDFISFELYRTLPAAALPAPAADKSFFRSGQGSNRLL